jgi:geranylgeranyl diphosphate synthase type II
MQFDLSRAQQVIELALKGLPLEKQPENLYQPVRYFLSLGGKRLRPMLTLMAASSYGKSLEEALEPALAVEVFHNFTLVHDDIMDNAPLRRSLPTVHEKWNRNIALLSGDLMLIEAYNLLLGLPKELLPTVLQKFNLCAAQVCQGQQWDMDFEQTPAVSQEQYLEMIGLKTAVLLGFALELGALIGGEKTQSPLWQQVGYLAGLGFQLKDDLLDVFAQEAKFGKQVGGDIIANKKTFLLIKALELASPSELNELNHWLSLKEFDPEQKINAVKNLYQELQIQTLTQSLIEDYFHKSIEVLDQIVLDNKSDIKDFLLQLMQRAH